MRQFFFSSMGAVGGVSAPVIIYENLSGLGDSIMVGYELVSPTTERYLKLLADEMVLTEVNGGITASELQVVAINPTSPGINRYQDYIRINGKYIISIGINDIGHGGNLTDYQTALNTVIDNLLNSYLSSDIILCNLCWINETEVKAMYSDYNTYYTLQKHADFNSAIESTATTKGVTFCDIYTPFIDRNDLLHDGIHPNSAGHILLKNTILSVI